mmetsp:Transcript_4186/g.9300  ORF Transcript_4186/g.9300 Transcript_4186/m.9300 type:complete len:326 (-) Transcript_4186:200-1177(-)
MILPFCRRVFKTDTLHVPGVHRKRRKPGLDSLCISTLMVFQMGAETKFNFMLRKLFPYLILCSVPPDVESEISAWIRFQHASKKADDQGRDIIDSLPVALREELAGTFYYTGLFSKVQLISRVPDDEFSGNLRRKLTAELIRKMSSSFYLANTKVASWRDAADKLIIVSSGTIGVFLPREREPLLILGPRDTFGETSILYDSRWGGLWGVHANFVAMTDCKVISVSTTEVLDVVAKNPGFAGVKRVLEQLGAYDVDQGTLDDDSKPIVQRATFNWVRMGRFLLSSLRKKGTPRPVKYRSTGSDSAAFEDFKARLIDRTSSLASGC